MTDYEKGYHEAITMVLDVINEMVDSGSRYHQRTLDELAQRIV